MMIFTLIFKNIKLIFRNPFTILLIILAPILLMLIVGITFSGEKLSNTVVGLVNPEDTNPFQTSQIQFRNFVNTDLTTAFKSCSNSLKAGEVELCAYFKTNKNSENEIETASAIYLQDDTRPQISQILQAFLDKKLDVITTEISTNSLNSLFQQANDTRELMVSSKDILDELLINIDSSKKELTTLKSQLLISSITYKKYSKELKTLQTTTQTQLNSFERNKKSLISSLNEVNSDLSDGFEDIEDSQHALKTIMAAYLVYSQISPDIKNHIDYDDLEDLSKTLYTLENNLAPASSTISSTINQLNKFDDLDNLQKSLTEINDGLSEIDPIINEGTEKLGTSLDKLDETEKDLKNLQTSLNQKIEFFDELLARDVSEMAEPIVKEVKTLHKDFKRVHQLAPSVVIIITLFIGLLLSNIITSLELSSKAYFRNLLSPISQFQIIMGIFYTSLIIIIVQIGFLLLVLKNFFGIEVFSNIIPLSIVLIHILVVFILLGIFLAYIFSSEQVSILVTTFIILFMFLLSGIMLPIELVPASISEIIQLNPVVIGEDLIRQIFYFSSSIKINYLPLSILYLYYIVLTSLIVYANSRRKKMLF